MPRIILAFNGDLESRLALYWLTHERGYDVVTLSVNLGQEMYLEPVGELALELGATAAQVLDRRELYLRDFALPVLQANAVYQSSCYLGSALARYVIAQELVRVARDEGCDVDAHSAASKGNDQVRMETAIAALNPRLKVLAPQREWNFKTPEEKLRYARNRNIPTGEPVNERYKTDRNLWGVSLYVNDLDAWDDPPAQAFVLTKPVEQAPDTPAMVTIGFEAGVPSSLNGQASPLVSLVRELNRLGGEHGVGRSDVVEDRLFGIKSREFYEAPTPTILGTAHRDLQSLVQSRETIQLREQLARRYADLVYMGHWFHDLRLALQGFFNDNQKHVTGEVRLKLFKGACAVQGRRSPHSLYDSRLANQSTDELFESQWAEGFTSLWTLPTRMAARLRPNDSPS
jgi:argininosuccinate synthase